MNKWKDTARTSKHIIKKYKNGNEVDLEEGTLIIVESDLVNNFYLISDTNPNKSYRRTYKLKLDEIIFEEYSVTRDINIQMLLADGWDSQDLLNKQSDDIDV